MEKKMKTGKNFQLITAILLALLLFSAVSGCGSSDSKNEETKKASFDGTIDGEKVSNEQDKESAGEFGAAIADNTIQIFLIPSVTSSIHIVGETNTDNTLPGNIKINELVLTVPAGIYTYKSGTVHIDKCPKAIGDVFKGTLDVVTENVADSSTKTIKAQFSVTVYSAANPNLNCAAKDDNNEQPVACGFSAEKCEGGVCCPFIECYEACFEKNCVSKCLNLDTIMECIECSSKCETDTCGKHMTSACEKAWTKLDECLEENECDGLADDDEIACARKYCCSELEGAFKK